MSRPAVYETKLPGLPMMRGKVRDVYDLGDRLLLVATDRLSAFDVVFPDPIPMKGIVLTQISLWWFAQTEGIVSNHLITANVDEYPAELGQHADVLRGRSMLVRKTKPLRGEFIVRGYLDGSAARQYEKDGTVCGIELLAGLKRRNGFGLPIFTPSTKAEEGHDINVSFDALASEVGRDQAEKGRAFALALYTYAHNRLLGRGLVLSDTKFEFGETESGEIILIDEALTPDSSRFWLRETYTSESEKPISLDKQYVRDYVEQIGWEKKPPAPKLPADVIEQTTQRYLKAYEMVTGNPLS